MTTLFGGPSQTPAFTPLALDTSVLSAWYGARASASAARAAGPQLSGASAQGGAGAQPAEEVTPPWDVGAAPSPLEELRRSVLATGDFVDLNDLGEFSNIAAPDDEKKLFALHQGLKKLASLAEEASEKDTTDTRRDFLDRRFQEGWEQVQTFINGADFEGLQVARGEVRKTAEAGLAIPRGADTFTTKTLHTGAFDAEVDAFTGATAFTIQVRQASGTTTDIAIDLADMGATPRTLDNVADHINTALGDAGFFTKFVRVKVGEEDENGIVPGENFGFEIRGTSAEEITFSAADAAPALTIAGVSGGTTDTAAAGQITTLTNLGAGAPTVAPSTRWEATGAVVATVDDSAESLAAFEALTGTTVNEAASSATPESEDGITPVDLAITASAAAPDGGLLVIGRTAGTADGAVASLNGQDQAVLAKYDSTGRQVWTRALGAADGAEDFSLAVSSDGSVVVAGAVSGALSTTVDRGGTDALVVKYDADGVERWTHRFGASGAETVADVAVNANGDVVVTGRTDGALTTAAAGGGGDAYVRALDADGATLWTRQIGGADDEAGAAVALDGNKLYVASVDNGAGVVRKYDLTAPDTDPALWTHDLGDLDSGAISGLAVDGAGGVYIAGSARSGFAPAATPVVAHTGGEARDAFLVKLSDAATPTEDYATFLGSNLEDSAADITVSGGAVYMVGAADEALPGGATQNGARDAFAAKFDAADGALEWAQQIAGRDGRSTAASVSVSTQRSDTLDRFGLPSGALQYQDERTIAERSRARAGDYFFITVNGRERTRITLEDGDTLRALSFRVDTALVLSGEADVRRTGDGDLLRITPNPGVEITLEAGPAGQDLLAGLGLEPGAVRQPPEDVDVLDDIPRVGLGLATAASVASRGEAKAAMDALNAAMSAVRLGYRDLTMDPEIKRLLQEGSNSSSSGPPPAYLTAQIANYQSALARLGGG